MHVDIWASRWISASVDRASGMARARRPSFGRMGCVRLAVATMDFRGLRAIGFQLVAFVLLVACLPGSGVLPLQDRKEQCCLRQWLPIEHNEHAPHTHT